MPVKKEAKNRRADRAGRPPGLSPTALGLLPAFVAVALYLPVLPYGWVWDDQFLVRSHGAGGVGAEGFRLLASFFYRAEWAMGFGTPLIAHLTGIALHGIATWLFFRLAVHVGAGPRIAFASALLFAAHPVHVEAVAYVSGRPDLLATVFALAALLLARTSELCSPEGCRSWKIYPAYAAMLAAVLSDEVAIVTPLILVGLDRWGPVRIPWRRRLTHYSGFFAIALVYLLVRYTAGGGAMPVPGTAHASSGIDDAARSWAAPMALFEYLKMLVIPHPLNALRSLRAEDVASWSAHIAPFAALVVLALVVAWRRSDALARSGALLLLLPLIPALPLPFFLGSFAEERAAYFASVGFCLLVGSVYAWAGHGREKRPILALAAIGIAAVAAYGTLARLPVWRDNISLLRAAAAAAPEDPAPHMMLVQHYTAAGIWPAALEEIDRAITLDPENQLAVAQKAMILSRLGRFPDSEIAARRAVELDPKDAISFTNLSDALLQQGKVAPAVEAGRRAVQIDSTIPNAWYNYGVALATSGDVPGALHAYRKAVALQPNNVLALNNLGALLGSTGKIEEARDLYVRLVASSPTSVEAHMNLALAYLRLGDRESAAREREIVRRLSPTAVRQLDEIFNQYVGKDAPSRTAPPSRTSTPPTR